MLGEFLRDRRAKLSPEALGFPVGRRRTPGLRREEVAQIAGVSVAWYTWLEQGRDIHPSLESLEAIVGALRMTEVERAHAFALAGYEQPDTAPPIAIAPPSVQAILDAISFPAYAADRASNVLAWNRLANKLFGYASREPADRNSLIVVFGDPASRSLLVNWAEEAAYLAASLRRAADEAPDDPVFAPVLERLRAFPEFRKLWARHEVKRRLVAKKQIRHGKLGVLTFETQSFHSAAFGLRLVLYVPDAATAKKLRV